MTAESAHGKCGADRGAWTGLCWQLANRFWTCVPRWHHQTSNWSFPTKTTAGKLFSKARCNWGLSQRVFTIKMWCRIQQFLLHLLWRSLKCDCLWKVTKEDASAAVADCWHAGTKRACHYDGPAGNFQHMTGVTSLHPVISKEKCLPGNRRVPAWVAFLMIFFFF